MTKEQWKEHYTWLEDAIPKGYKSIYYEDTEEEISLAKEKTEIRNLEARNKLLGVKLKEIDNCKKIISRRKRKISKVRCELSEETERIAYLYHEQILEYEYCISIETDEWFLKGFLKDLEKAKQGYYGLELEHQSNWLKHLYKRLREWEASNYEQDNKRV